MRVGAEYQARIPDFEPGKSLFQLCPDILLPAGCKWGLMDVMVMGAPGVCVNVSSVGYRGRDAFAKVNVDFHPPPLCFPVLMSVTGALQGQHLVCESLGGRGESCT